MLISERSHLQLCVLLFLTLPLSDVLQRRRWREGSSIINNIIEQLQNMHILRCLQPPESIQNQRFFSRGIFGVLEHTLNHPFNITTKMVRYTGPNPQSNWPIASDLTFPSRPEAVGTGGWPPRAFRDCWLDDAPRKVAMLWLKTLVPQMDG